MHVVQYLHSRVYLPLKVENNIVLIKLLIGAIYSYITSLSCQWLINNFTEQPQAGEPALYSSFFLDKSLQDYSHGTCTYTCAIFTNEIFSSA